MPRSKYDSLASLLVKDIIKCWKKEANKGTEYSHFNAEIDTPFIQFELDARLFFTNEYELEVLDSTGADGRVFDDDECYQTPFIDIDIAINPNNLPAYWSDLYMLLCDIIRHEIEHITQEGPEIGNYKTGKPNEDDSIERGLIQQRMIPSYMYLLLPKEIDANLQGLRFESKKRREPFIKTINRNLDCRDISEHEKNIIKDMWRKRAKHIGGIPSF